MKQKKRFLLVLMLALAMISGRAEHTMALDLADVKTNNVTYSTETNVATFTTTWGGVYWNATDIMQSFTTATLVVDAENTDMDVYITVRYTAVGANSTTDVNTVISQGSTTASVEIPATGTLNSIRVANRGKSGNVKLVSVTLSGLRDTYALSLTTLGAGWTSSYDASNQTITFGPSANEGAVSTWVARGWSVGNAYLNDYKTVVVEFEASTFDVILDISYTNTSEAAANQRKTVAAGSKRVSVRMPSDVKTITNICLKNSTNPTNANTQTLVLKKAYLTTEEIDFFDMTKATNAWDNTKSSYDASTYTITWSDITRHGWYVNANTYNDYKSIVIEFQPAPVAITGYLRYYATSDDETSSTASEVDYTVPAEGTTITLSIPSTIHKISAIHLKPASACSLTLTNAYATSKEYETGMTITLSTDETVLADNWGSAGIMLTKEQLALAQAGDKISVNVTAVSETTTDPRCVALQTGSYSGFEGVGSVAMGNATLPAKATFTLTDAMLNIIRGNVSGTNSGLCVKGSGCTFNQVDLIHYIYKIKGQPTTNLWSGEQVISWSTNPSQYVTLPKSAFATASTGMKLRMSFKDLKLSAQGRIASSEWDGMPDANTYETLKTDWGNYYEFTITASMLTELQAHGVNITGVGYTLTSVDLIDPDCEYDITSTFDTADIIAWETTDGTPNLTVTITNNEAYEITVPINIALMTDMFTDFNTYSANVTLAAGETKVKDVEFKDLTPGFYRMAANVAGNKLCTYYIGYNPTAIVSPDDSQEDFATFWGTWKERLAAIPIDAELTLLNGDTGSDTRNIYEVKYKSVPETADENAEPVYIYGYYAEPKAAGTYPCIIHFHGTSTTGSLTMPSGTTEGWCEFRFSARGQTLDREKNGNVKYRTDANKESSADFYQYCLGSNDNHYYRYVYLDTRRAVDFVFSRDKVNKNAVFAAGGSQGGCLTYVCAALSDGKIRAIAPSITGHADFVHTMEIVGWPTNVFNNWINASVTAGTYSTYEEGKAALLAHQSYFDTKNFAKWIYCPVITNFSLQDNTDGPHLNISPYNLLTNVAAADKQYSINQFKGHATADNWSTTYMAFFQNYINAGTPLTIPYALTVSEPGYATYYNSTATQLPSGVEAATIDGADNSEKALTINWRYNGDENEKKVIPGGTAVMVKATTGNYNLSLLPSNTTAAPTGNLLHGSDVQSTTTGGDKFYKLTYGSANGDNANNFGWYWGAENGVAFTMPAHKAWLALNTTAGTRSYFSLDGGDGTTGIGTIETKLDPDTLPEEGWYDLRGQRINKPTQKGLYILNGKKIIVR